MKTLIRLLDRGSLVKALLIFMLVSLVPLADFYLLLVIRDYFGTYLIMAAVAATALLGLFFAIGPLRRIVARICFEIDSGKYPEESFEQLAGVLIAAVLIVFPGFGTDIVGFLCIFPVSRRIVGRIVTRRMQSRLNELYEYIKVYES